MVGVVGLGYVGLPLAILQAKTGFRVIGIEEAPEKVALINKGKSYITDVQDKDLAQVLGAKRFSATTNLEVLNKCDVVLVCVPTPLIIKKDPDINAIIKVTKAIAKHAHPDSL